MGNYEKYGFCPFSKNLTSDDCDTICFCEDCNTFFDGYNMALEDVYAKAKEMQLEQINNLKQLSPKRNGKMWASYMITYLGHIENACKRLLKGWCRE